MKNDLGDAPEIHTALTPPRRGFVKRDRSTILADILAIHLFRTEEPAKDVSAYTQYRIRITGFAQDMIHVGSHPESTEWNPANDGWYTSVSPVITTATGRKLQMVISTRPHWKLFIQKNIPFPPELGQPHLGWGYYYIHVNFNIDTKTTVIDTVTGNVVATGKPYVCGADIELPDPSKPTIEVQKDGNPEPQEVTLDSGETIKFMWNHNDTGSGVTILTLNPDGSEAGAESQNNDFSYDVISFEASVDT